MPPDSDPQGSGPRRPPAPASAPPRPRRTPAAPQQPAPAPDEPPRYTRYRAGWRPFRRADDEALGGVGGETGRARRRGGGEGGGGASRRGWRTLWGERLTAKRVLAAIAIAIVGWIALSVVLFLINAQLQHVSPSPEVKAALDGGGFPLTSANNILVLGSDQRTKKTHEPGASTSGPSRSDVIMLIRTGAGHSARLSIPRDTVVDIPGHGLQKINAAYTFGGPALAITTVKRLLGIPINHLVEVNFDSFPSLIDAMGGVDYTGPCVVSYINGGFRNGGYTLRLSKGTHHLDGQQALALARTRHNVCNPSESDLTRAMHQQALFQAMKSRLLSFSSFLRLPLVAWNAPAAIRSDMGGPTLLALFSALAVGGTPKTRLLTPSGALTLPDGSVGLSVSDTEKRAAVRQFLAG